MISSLCVSPWVALLLFVLFPSLGMFNSATSWSLQPKLLLTFTSPASSSLFASMRSMRMSLCVACVRKLWPGQKPCRLLLPCWVVPSADTGMEKALPKHLVSSHGSAPLCELSHYNSVIPRFHVVWAGTWRSYMRAGSVQPENQAEKRKLRGSNSILHKKTQSREGWDGVSLRMLIDHKLQEGKFWSDRTKNISPCERSKNGTGNQKSCGVSMLEM